MFKKTLKDTTLEQKISMSIAKQCYILVSSMQEAIFVPKEKMVFCLCTTQA